MAFIKAAVKLIVKEHFTYHFAEPVLTLGVPEIYATHAELTEWFAANGGRCQVDAGQAVVTPHPLGARLGWVSAATFLQSFGFSQATSIDIPGCDHRPDLIHNLNEPLPAPLLNRFNLILDPGTVEHVFDIKTCLANVVGALRVGGVIVHLVPIYSYNGGYFSINPNVLHEFYRANGFDKLKAYIILWDRYRPYTGRYRCYEYSEDLLGPRHALADYDQCRFSPELLFFARKTAARDTIVNPIQFYGTAQPATPAAGPAVPAWKRFYRLVHGAAARILPFSVLYQWDAMIARRRSLSRTRRQSFWA